MKQKDIFKWAMLGYVGYFKWAILVEILFELSPQIQVCLIFFHFCFSLPFASII